nr:uncharacterized protein CTRU02_06304 [Colletotrichum truncatum]KAF6792808.1 hypothetical protein CTRU02_06304 [Colletotrichum truncatum]
MAVEVFRGRYTDETVILIHLKTIFPREILRISSERGRFFCTIPRKLTETERDVILRAIEADHYTQN